MISQKKQFMSHFIFFAGCIFGLYIVLVLIAIPIHRQVVGPMRDASFVSTMPETTALPALFALSQSMAYLTLPISALWHCENPWLRMLILAPVNSVLVGAGLAAIVTLCHRAEQEKATEQAPGDVRQ